MKLVILLTSLLLSSCGSEEETPQGGTDLGVQDTPTVISGSNGTKGKDGIDGNSGADGTRGVDGNDGEDGMVGPSGPADSTGGKGATGPKGEMGQDGEDCTTTCLSSDRGKIVITIACPNSTSIFKIKGTCE